MLTLITTQWKINCICLVKIIYNSFIVWYINTIIVWWTFIVIIIITVLRRVYLPMTARMIMGRTGGTTSWRTGRTSTGTAASSDDDRDRGIEKDPARRYFIYSCMFWNWVTTPTYWASLSFSIFLDSSSSDVSFDTVSRIEESSPHQVARLVRKSLFLALHTYNDRVS